MLELLPATYDSDLAHDERAERDDARQTRIERMSEVELLAHDDGDTHLEKFADVLTDYADDLRVAYGAKDVARLMQVLGNVDAKSRGQAANAVKDVLLDSDFDPEAFEQL